jgi:hypothetical protein
LLQQRRFVGLGGGEVARLDVAEPADFFRNRGKADGERMVVGLSLLRISFEHRSQPAISLLSARRSWEQPKMPNGRRYVASGAGSPFQRMRSA